MALNTLKKAATGQIEVGAKPTLLIVDDDDGQRAGLDICLRKDFRVLLAASGEEAISIAHREVVHVATMDIRMPGMSGIECLARLRGIDPRIRVIMVTAFETAETIRQALRYGAVDYLNKPFGIEEIRQAVLSASKRYSEAEKPSTESGTPDIETPENSGSGASASFVASLSSTITADTIAAFIHKLNGELAMIYNGAEMIEIETMEIKESHPSLQQTTGLLKSAVQRCAYTIERFRNVMGRHPGSLRSLNIVTIIDEVIAEQSKSRGKRVTVSIPMIECELLGDRELLFHLFDNLIRNAFEAIEGRENGQVSVEMSPAPDGMIAVVVSDNGVGIRAEELPHIFGPDYSTKPGGLGIGLHLVQRAAAIHSGTVTCESIPGSYTRFIVTLPCVSKETSEEA